MENLSIATHPLMWIATGISILLIIFQSAIFVRKSLKVGREIGLTDHQMKSAMKSSMIASLGPSFAILVGMVSLLTKVGAPMSWMRLSLIGSVSHELMAAQFAESFTQKAMGAAATSEIIFANAVWVMALGSVAWPLFTGIFTHKIDKFRGVIAGGNKKTLEVISSAASLGAFSFLVADSLVTEEIIKFNDYSLACFLGGAIMGIIMIVNKKKKLGWLKEWGLSIAMFLSMIITAILV